MKIGIVGAGGLGGYFGGRLAQAGHAVHFLARGTHLTAMREHGLHVQSVRGDFAIPPEDLAATDDPRAIGQCEVVLFTVKAFDTDAAAAKLPPMLALGTAVISLQNGIDNEERLGARIGPEHVVGGVAFIFAGIEKPGMVRDTGGPGKIAFGELDRRRSDRLETFLKACERAGIDAAIAPDVRVTLWTKYAFICAQAGLTAATRLPIGEIRRSPPAWAFFRQVVEEVWHVGRGEGVSLSDSLVDEQVAFASSLQPEGRSSLYDDMVAGRRMELEALLGELVRRADRIGIAAPAARALYAVLEPWARRADASRA